MKILENKITEITEGEKELAYADLARFCINRKDGNKGFTISDMRLRLIIVDTLEEAGKVIELEDAHADLLKASVRTTQWGFMHKDLIAFSEAVEAMADKK